MTQKLAWEALSAKQEALDAVRDALDAKQEALYVEGQRLGQPQA